MRLITTRMNSFSLDLITLQHDLNVSDLISIIDIRFCGNNGFNIACLIAPLPFKMFNSFSLLENIILSNMIKLFGVLTCIYSALLNLNVM